MAATEKLATAAVEVEATGAAMARAAGAARAVDMGLGSVEVAGPLRMICQRLGCR